MRCKKRENIHQRKIITHTQDSIYVVRQFAYVHEVAGISLFSGKKIQSATVQFSLSKMTTKL